MKLSELMNGVTVNPNYSGVLTHNDMVLAINVAPGTNTDVKNYAVVQLGVEGTPASLNPETSEKTYIRSGKASTKTGNQRTFAITGERYVGDEAQDYMLSRDIKYGIGNDVVTDYVYFDLRTGKGEKGTVMISVEADGDGDATGGCEISINLMQNGAAPQEYTWSNS